MSKLALLLRLSLALATGSAPPIDTVSSAAAPAAPLPHDADIVIVGAGWSGLAAAQTIHEHNQRQSSPADTVSFHILEATDHAGGRTLNADVVSLKQSVATDDVVELGGEWLAPSHAHVIALAAKLGYTIANGGLFHRPFNVDATQHPNPLTSSNTSSPSPQPPPCGGDCEIVMLTPQGPAHATSDVGMLAALPAALRAEIANVTERVRSMSEQVSCEGGPSQWPRQLVMAWDGLSYAGWLAGLGMSEEAAYWLSEFADDAEDTRAMSLLGVLWTYNCSNRLVGDSKEDWYRVRGGTQGPALLLADRFKANITYTTPVAAVSAVSQSTQSQQQRRQQRQQEQQQQQQQDRPFEVVTVSGTRIAAGRVLLAGLSAPCLLNLDFDPPLPASTAQLLARLPLGTSLKYMVVYPTPWWRHRGLLGKIENLWFGPPEDTYHTTAAYGGNGGNTANTTTPSSSHQERYSSYPPVASKYITECLDNSPSSWSRGVIMCFIEGNKNRAFFRDLPTAAARQAHVVSFLGQAFNDTAAAAGVVSVEEHNWADKPFTRGAYSSYFPPGVLSSFWPEWRSILDHDLAGTAAPKLAGVHIAGGDYGGNGMGYIDGAVKTGQEAATRMLELETRRRRQHRGERIV